MKKFILVTLIVMVLFSSIAFAQKTKVPTIGFAVFDYSNAYVAYIRKGVENYCADGKAKLQFVDAANDQTRQNEQIMTLIARGVDALIVNPVDPGAGQLIIDAAKKEKIPVVFVNRAPFLEVLETYAKSWYVGIDWMAPALVQADLVKADWDVYRKEMDKNGDGVLQYVLIQGNISQQDAIYRTRAIRETFEAWNKDGSMKNEMLAIQEAGWNTTKAKEVMETWIVKYGNKIEAVISNNDAMAMGAVEALRAHGYFDNPKTKVRVYGINALPQVWPLIEKGEMAGTVLTSPWLQAVACVDILLDSLNGRTPLANVGPEFQWTGASGREIRCMDYAITLSNLDAAKKAYINCGYSD